MNYNWRNTLSDFASVAGVLGGFSVALIGVVLGWSLSSTEFLLSIPFGHFSVLFFGLSTVLFVSASQLLLHAKSHDVFSCTDKYLEGLQEESQVDWESNFKEANKEMGKYYAYGRVCYNSGIFALYLGILFLVAPYNVYIALSTFIFGIILEFWQIKKGTGNLFTLNKRFKIVLVSVAIVLILVIASLTASFFSYSEGFSSGQKDIVAIVSFNEELMVNLSRPDCQAYLNELFVTKQNYTQLLYWESKNLNYSNDVITRQNDPREIISYHLGRCGEFSILYAAVCIANDIPARIVSPAIIIPGVVDHVWVEINPSKDGVTWIPVDPTGACDRIQHGVSIYENPAMINNPSAFEDKYTMILAFETTTDNQTFVVDRTSYYNSYG
jgi:hypothetical protein